MQISSQGLTLIKGFEQFRARAYWDATGRKWSVGYGETLGVTRESEMTEPQAAEQLSRRVNQDFGPGVLAAIPGIELLPREFDALCSLAYNIGTEEFHNSSVASLLRAGNKFGAAEHFALFNESGGQVLTGLVLRRAHEMRIFLVGY